MMQWCDCCKNWPRKGNCKFYLRTLTWHSCPNYKANLLGRIQQIIRTLGFRK